MSLCHAGCQMPHRLPRIVNISVPQGSEIFFSMWEGGKTVAKYFRSPVKTVYIHAALCVGIKGQYVRGTVHKAWLYKSFSASNQLNPTSRNSTLKLQTSAELQMAWLKTALVPAAAAPVLRSDFLFPSLDTRSESDSRPHWRSILLCLSSLRFDWQSVAISWHATRARVPRWRAGHITGEPYNADLRRQELSIGAVVSEQTQWEETIRSHTFARVTKWQSCPDFSFHPWEPALGLWCSFFASFSAILFSLMKRSASGQEGALIPEEFIVFLHFFSRLSFYLSFLQALRAALLRFLTLRLAVVLQAPPLTSWDH